MALHSELRTISLCAGGAGLDIGLELAMPGARAVCFVEREAFGVARLVEAMQQGFLAQAPVWSDVSTFRGRPWRGLVDGVIGGIPCQPYSAAGRRKGSQDERDLWPDTRRIINAARPWFVLIENVTGMLVGTEGEIAGAARVRRDLAGMSFRTEIVLARASEVGASHERARTFILALAECAERGEGRTGRPPAAGGRSHAEPSGSGCHAGVGLADASNIRQHGFEPLAGSTRQGAGEGRMREPARDCDSLANPISRRHGRDAGAARRGSRERTAAEGAGEGALVHATSAVRRPKRRGSSEGASEGGDQARIWNVRSEDRRADDDGSSAPSLFPPGPGDRAAWERIARDSPGLLPATTQPRVRGMADGMASRVDQLRMLGNGVVPLQAAYAVRLLVDAHARFGASPFAEYLREAMNQ